MNTSLYEKDLNIINLEKIINNRYNTLEQIYKNIQNTKHINPYMVSVSDNYKKYFINLLNTKKQQLNKLFFLKKYIENNIKYNNTNKQHIHIDNNFDIDNDDNHNEINHHLHYDLNNIKKNIKIIKNEIIHIKKIL